MKSLTIPYNGRPLAIITECDICKDFDPNDNTSRDTAKYMSVKALWDTGCSGIAISQKVVDTLGLIGNGSTTVHNAGEDYVSQYYPISIRLPNNADIHFLRATLAKTNGFDILLGMDVICLGDFSVSNYEGKTCMSFRVPSIKKIDYVEENVKYEKIFKIQSKKGIMKCPCNSGKLYKNCHGAEVK